MAKVAAVVALVVVALMGIADVALDEPIRRHVESAINAQLTGYRATIGDLDFHAFGASIDLDDVVVRQDPMPEPPVLAIDRLSASVQWWALLHGAVVADMELHRPRVHVTQEQAVEEDRDATPVEDRHWQEALEAIYPLEINRFVIEDGSLTYAEAEPRRVTRITKLEAVAENIRNVASRKRQYPSPVRLSAVVFGRGRLKAHGHADFLAVPYPGARVDVTLEDVPLAELAPVVRHVNLDVKGGVLRLQGALEYGPAHKEVDLAEVAVHDAAVDWVHEAATAEAEQRRVEKAADAVAQVEQKPETAVRVEKVRLDGELGFSNRATDPPFRLYLAETELAVNGFSNVRADRHGTATLLGRPMGTGAARVDVTFSGRPHDKDLTVDTRIVDVSLRRMNDMLRAYADVDVNGGQLACFSELAVDDGRIDGYVKPLLEDLDVYGGPSDRRDSILQRVWEALVGGAAELFQNQPEQQVATKAEVAGRIDDSRVSTWQALVGVLRNAFVQALRPQLESAKG